MFSLKFLFACKSVKTQFLISAKLLIFLFDYQFAQDNSYSAELLSFKSPPNLEPLANWEFQTLSTQDKTYLGFAGKPQAFKKNVKAFNVTEYRRGILGSICAYIIVMCKGGGGLKRTSAESADLKTLRC